MELRDAEDKVIAEQISKMGLVADQPASSSGVMGEAVEWNVHWALWWYPPRL